jgi:hypothetical protein
MYNNKEGSLFVEGSVKSPTSTPWLAVVNDTTFNNRLGIFTRMGATPNFVGAQFQRDNVPIQITTTNPGTEQVNLRNENIVRAATNYNATSASLFVNGFTVGTSAITLPSQISVLHIGRYQNIGVLNSHIRKLGYWPKRLSNTTLQALTLSSLSFAKYFAQDNSLYTGTGPGVEVYRNSQATYFDSNGVLRTAGANKPRFDYDPATGTSKGLLVEEQRTNKLLQSQNFNATGAWFKVNNAAVISNAITAPDGTDCTPTNALEWESICISGTCSRIFLGVGEEFPLQNIGCLGKPNGALCDTNHVYTDGEKCVNGVCRFPDGNFYGYLPPPPPPPAR